MNDRSRPAQAIGDEHNPEWTEADFAAARPAAELLPADAVGLLVKKRGRPRLAEGEHKEKVSLRLSPQVLAFFRGEGEGWQTRIDEVLRGFVAAAGGEATADPTGTPRSR